MTIRSVRSLLLSLAIAGTASLGISMPVAATDYDIDAGHSFIEFRIKHLGYSWLYGRFNKLSGDFTHDPSDPAANRIKVDIDPASVDTNHAERDKHLRNEDFFDVEKFTAASFESTGFKGTVDGGTLSGNLTLMGVTKPISFEIKKIGEGKDPWGGYRAGFEGSIVLNRKDFGMDYNLGPAGWDVEINLGIEGIKKK